MDEVDEVDGWMDVARAQKWRQNVGCVCDVGRWVSARETTTTTTTCATTCV
jgi:hypothetical protein